MTELETGAPGPRMLPRLVGTVAGLTGVFLLAVAVRCVGFPALGPPEHFSLIDPDDYYHARRIGIALRHLPSLPPRHDPLIAHPEGYALHWPPGFDYLVALLARAGGVGPDSPTLPLVGTGIVVLLGAATALLAYALARRGGASRPWAGLGALFLALSPIHIEYTRAGRLDHHVAEPLFIGAAALLLLGARRASTAAGHYARGAAAGALLGASFWLWPSAFFPVALLAGVLLAEQILRPGDPRPGRILAGALSSTLSLLLPLAFGHHAAHGWVFYAPSRTHVVILAALLVASFGISLVRRRNGPRLSTAKDALVASGLAALVGALVLLLPPVRAAVVEAWAFGQRSGLWSLVREQRPLFELPWPQIPLLGTYLVFVVPFLLPFAVRAPQGLEARGFLAACGAPLLVVGLLQIRFLPLAWIFVAPLAALALERVAVRCTERARGHARPSLLHALPWVVLLGGLCLLWPVVDYLAHGQHLPGPAHRGRDRAARWLRTQHRADPLPMGVMVPLSAGQPVAHLSGLPVVGSTLIEPTTWPANRDALVFYLTADTREAEALLERRRVGWILTQDLPLRSFARQRDLIGRTASELLPIIEFQRAVASRLHLDYGSGAWLASRWVPALGFAQHVWESHGNLRPGRTMVFRRVRGALVEARLPPSTPVELRLPLLTNRGRPFLFRDRRRVGSEGGAVFRLPYPTTREAAFGPGSGSDRTRAVGPAVLVWPAGRISFEVTAAAVERGERIPLELRSAP